MGTVSHTIDRGQRSSQLKCNRDSTTHQTKPKQRWGTNLSESGNLLFLIFSLLPPFMLCPLLVRHLADWHIIPPSASITLVEGVRVIFPALCVWYVINWRTWFVISVKQMCWSISKSGPVHSCKTSIRAIWIILANSKCNCNAKTDACLSLYSYHRRTFVTRTPCQLRKNHLA